MSSVVYILMVLTGSMKHFIGLHGRIIPYGGEYITNLNFVILNAS